jgi:hypothetical protein
MFNYFFPTPFRVLLQSHAKHVLNMKDIIKLDNPTSESVQTIQTIHEQALQKFNLININSQARYTDQEGKTVLHIYQITKFSADPKMHRVLHQG